MKAVHMTAIGGPEVLHVVDVPEPQPGPGFVRVRNRAIAVNFHDINTHLFEALMTGAIHLPIDTMPLSDTARAHARIEQQETVGKVILVP